MTGKDYSDLVVAHLLDSVDTTNARLVFLRAPDLFKKKGSLSKLNECTEALKSWDFPKAFSLLDPKDPAQ